MKRLFLSSSIRLPINIHSFLWLAGLNNTPFYYYLPQINNDFGRVHDWTL